jgi:glycosyltransferase involved in cell wall biosynthesis
MKILRVSSDIYPSSVGGLGLHVHEMSRLQAEYGNEVTVFTSNANHNNPEEVVSGYRIRRFKPLTNIYGNSIMPSMFIEMIKERKKYDVIHAHSQLFLSTNLCALVKKIGSSPLVITNHGLESQNVPDWVNNTYNPTIARWTLNSADRVLCYTENDKEKLERIGIKPEKIVIVHNGIDTGVFKPSDEMHVRNNRILWIGRFVRGKGVQYLIEAMAILVKDRPELKLLLIGSGPYKEVIDKMIIDLNLEKNVEIKGSIPNNELPCIYQSSDVFILPSLFEGLPRTVLEAMSCGTPIVCTRLPQLIDIVDGCAYMVSVKDPEAIADGIVKILSDESTSQKFAACGRKRVIDDYSWEDTVKKTINVYKTII